MKIYYLWFGKQEEWTVAHQSMIETLHLRFLQPDCELASNIDEADIIVVYNRHLTRLSRFNYRLFASSIFREHFRKILVYDESDDPLGIFSGFYVSLPSQRFDSRYHVAVPYLFLQRFFDPLPSQTGVRRYRASFMGRRSHSIRDKLIDSFTHDGLFIQDSSSVNFFDWNKDNDTSAAINRFNEVLSQSLYSICPRGIGTSSYRLFESLAFGSVPIVISDDWVEPIISGYTRPWYSLRESEIFTLPSYIESVVDHWHSDSDYAVEYYRELLLDGRSIKWFTSRRPAVSVRRSFSLIYRSLLHGGASKVKW